MSLKQQLQRCTVAVVLRVLHAAMAELPRLDSRAAREFSRMPEGLAFAVHTCVGGPSLFVQWRGGCLLRLAKAAESANTLSIKSLPLSFRLFCGAMSVPQAYARHAFTVRGDLGEVMILARLVDLVESYLFPRFITRRILTDVPRREVCSLRLYGRMLLGFLSFRYKKYE